MSSPFLLRSIPALTWLRSYNLRWLRGDVLAGVTLAAYLLPAALGDASLANLRPEAGLYACLFGGLVFWIFCGSRYTVASVTSAISLVIGTSLGEINGGNVMRYGALAAGTALLVSLIAFIAWLAKAGVMVHFISESVMTGFKCGVALFLASTQLPCQTTNRTNLSNCKSPRRMGLTVTKLEILPGPSGTKW
jgi:MFS superfamily sulfate permease-like transporter